MAGRQGGDDLRYPKPGEVIHTAPKAFYNRVIDLSRAERDGRYNQGSPGPEGGRSVLTVLVRNATGAAVPAFGVLELTDTLAYPSDEGYILETAIFDGIAPAGGGRPFAILADALAAAEVGVGMVLGAVPCKVTGVGGYAAAVSGNTTALAAGKSGVPLLWSESGTAQRWGYVLLTGQAVGAWSRCRKVLTHTYCSGGNLFYNAEFDYIDAGGHVLYTNSEPCAVASGTLAGIANGTCTGCNALNVALTLTRTTDTTWAYQGAELGVCGGASTAVTLTLAGSTLTLLFNSGGTAMATYTNPSASGYTGAGSVTLNKASSDARCVSWPAAITLNPA